MQHIPKCDTYICHIYFTFFFNDIYIMKHLQVKLLLLEYKEETDKVLDFKEFTVSRAEINC